MREILKEFQKMEWNFFGYYDKSPWDASDRYMLCLRVKNATKTDASGDPAEIILFDTQNKNSYKVIAKTNTWNVQQGCMLQWLGPDFKEYIIYNDFRDGNYCSIILDLSTNKEKVIEAPVYADPEMEILLFPWIFHACIDYVKDMVIQIKLI